MAVKEKLKKDSGVGGGKDFDHIVEKLQAKPKAKGANNYFVHQYCHSQQTNKIITFPGIMSHLSRIICSS